MANTYRILLVTAALASAVLLGGAAIVESCPFCSAVSMTLSEEMGTNDVAIIARLKHRPAPLTTGEQPQDTTLAYDSGKCVFELVSVLKGGDALKELKEIEVLYFGDQPVGSQFLVFGVDPQNVAWGTPTPLSERAVKYVEQLPKLPESGGDRLAFFQKYFEDEDPLLAADAYDEFARAPYADVQELKDLMDRPQLLEWIKDTETSASRRRLYLTMLGVCGANDDVAVLEEMIKSDDRESRTALDALIACYLNLKGADGLPLIEDLFLKNEKAEYTDTYSAIMALRFHGQETDIIPRERVMASLRHMLDRPQLADLVIPDLARWQDWSVQERLVELFKNADEDTAWVRVPVINYLRACPDPKAAEYIEELAQIDPDAVKRANQFFPTGMAASASAPANTVPSNFTRDASETARQKEQQAAGAAEEQTDDAAPSLAPGDAAGSAEAKQPAEAPAPATTDSSASEPAEDDEASENAAAVAVVPPQSNNPAAAELPADVVHDSTAAPADASAARVLAMAGGAALVLAALYLVILRGSRAARAV